VIHLTRPSPTLKEVAARCGVSTATVSRVINRDRRISEETSKRVLQAVEDLGYSPNPFARGLKTNKSRTIGFIVPEFTNDFFMRIARGIESRLRQDGYTLVICNANENRNDEAARLDLLLDQGVDGVIVIPSSSRGAHLRAADARHVPLVLVDRVVEDYQTDAILVDNINGTYHAVEAALAKGHKRIGFIGGNMDLTSARERLAGYTRALEDYHIPFQDEYVFFGDFHQDSGYELMGQLLALAHPPECVFLSNVFMHLGAAKYLLEHQQAKRRVPELIGFDEMDFSSSLGFCTIMVRQPIEEIGKIAAETILDRIRGNHHPSRIQRLKTEIVQFDRKNK